jgi:iron complex outermembrane receptor protein
MIDKHLKHKTRSTRLNPIIAAIRDSINDKNVQSIALSALMVTGMAVMPSANAQEVDAVQAETDGKASSQGMETIIVTSRKRVENLQDTPLSITALGSTKLDELGIENFDDYALMLPSLSYQSSGPGLSQVYMRGASDGGSGNASGSQPGVAIYLDEQPVTAIGRNLDLHIYDIERVEALAGPQSTLFGASAQSGTIRIITNKPQTDFFEGGFDVSYGTTKSGDASHSLEGFVNLPVSDNAAIRLVAWTKKDGGYIDNIAGTRTYGLFTDGGNFSTVEEDNDDLVKENFNELTNSGARVALKVNLNDDWTATAKS